MPLRLEMLYFMQMCAQAPQPCKLQSDDQSQDQKSFSTNVLIVGENTNAFRQAILGISVNLFFCKALARMSKLPNLCLHFYVSC